VIRDWSHKELIESVEAAWDASRQADEPNEDLLIPTELSYVRE